VSHHFNSAADRADGRINPCDLYAFPAAPGTTALIVTVKPDAGRSSPTTFRPDARYEFVVASNGSTSGDTAFRAAFTEPDDGGSNRSDPPRQRPAARTRGIHRPPSNLFHQDEISQLMATPPGFARPFIDAVVADLR
jgi:Domain of unknown function (DUF4331)